MSDRDATWGCDSAYLSVLMALEALVEREKHYAREVMMKRLM
jgi:hypothetical protein